jgi:predicted ABC-type ATPase
VWVPSAEVSIKRVRERVALGGHGVPEDTIRRRYQRGLNNFFRLYLPLTNSWRFYENENRTAPHLIAKGSGIIEKVIDESLWTQIKKQVTP